MSRILILGYNLPQFEKNAKVEAGNYRTWQFVQPLMDDGNNVCLCAAQKKSGDIVEIPHGWRERFQFHDIQFGKLGWMGKLQKVNDAYHPDCIIAVNADICLYATRLKTRQPLWMDFYGDYIMFVQSACYRAGSNRGLHTTIQYVQQMLAKGDKFSTCSQPQKHALVGQLGLMGRLNYQTFGYEFAERVLPGAYVEKGYARHRIENPVFAEKGIKKDDFLILWCGGYNTWTDIETLFTAISGAMTQDPKVKFVSVGANSYQAPDNVYERFLRKIEQSEFKDRFVMLGWRPWQEISGYYLASDVGINIDALHYETTYGTRTRLLEMIASGLPVITSLGCELSYLLLEEGSALTFQVGDWVGLRDQILAMARDAGLCERVSACALRFASNELSFASTTECVRNWARASKKAPDAEGSGTPRKLDDLKHIARAYFRQMLWKTVGLDR